MLLQTRRKLDDYERVIDIFVAKSEGILPEINNQDSCKLVLLKTGRIHMTINEDAVAIEAPSAFFLSNRDRVEFGDREKFQASIIYFKPAFVNDSFQYDRLYAGEFEEMYQTTLYQDYLIVRDFIMKDGNSIKCCRLSDESLTNLTGLIGKLEYELGEQYDGYWPCRSRSYFIEIMFFINFCYRNSPYAFEKEENFTVKVIEYLNNHIDEKIALSTLTSKFHVNRNYLNQEFEKETGMTCLSYLTKIRLELAALWLKETEIPIAEIARRVGYMDANYFGKAFRKMYGKAPREYREAAE